MTKHTDHTYLIDADHRLPEYTFRATQVRVREQSDGYFATHPKLGCGKTYESEWDAITHLFADHDCRNVQVSETPYDN